MFHTPRPNGRTGKSRSRQQDLPATAPCHGMQDWSERSPFPPFRPHPCNQERKCHVLPLCSPRLLGLTLLASGCAGGFSRHYQAADDHVRPVDTLESCSAPRVEQLPASVMEKRLAAALADGYVRLGRATWESAVPASADDAVAQAGRVGPCLVLQSVTPTPQQPEKPHYQAHPGFVSRIGQRGIFAEDNSGNLGGPSTQPAVRYRNDAVFLARTR